MLDKNGIEIKTGDVVEISGAYFKNDNGFYYVEHSAGDPSWCGSDHSLRKISKTGKISKAARNICFWPILVTTNSWVTKAEAKAWNAEHATIEVRNDINRAEVAKHFQEEAASLDDHIRFAEFHFGKESEDATRSRRIKSIMKKSRKAFRHKCQGGLRAVFFVSEKIRVNQNKSEYIRTNQNKSEKRKTHTRPWN